MHHGRLLGVVIPARNEEEHIEAVLSSLPEMVDLAVVVNDGSVDNTGALASHADAPCDVVVLKETATVWAPPSTEATSISSVCGTRHSSAW